MSDNFVYFLAAGRSLEGVHQYDAARVAYDAYMKNLATKIGADPKSRYVTRDGGDRWVAFGAVGDTVPEGMKRIRGGGIAPKQDAAGKRIQALMAQAPPLRTFEEYIGVVRTEHFIGPMSDRGTVSILSGKWGLEYYGDTAILVTHAKPDGTLCSTVPPDARQLLRSEYWALRETHECSSTPERVPC